MQENIVDRPGAPSHAVNPSAPRVPNAHLFDAGGQPVLLSVAQDASTASTLRSARRSIAPWRLAMRTGSTCSLRWPDWRKAPRSSSRRRRRFQCMRCRSRWREMQSRLYLLLRAARKFRRSRRQHVGRCRQGGGRPAVADAVPGAKLTLAYLGGEPLATGPSCSRRRTTRPRRLRRRIDIGFALTTNAALLTAEDADFFERYGFTVTVSIDGIGDVHDQLRPFKSGQGSYRRVVERSKHLLSRSPRRCHVAARVTVTPRNLFLPQTLDALAGLGFDGVAFSPVLSAPAGSDQMGRREFEAMLAQLIACGREFERRLAGGEVYPFSNMINTLRQIHQGNRDAYPCGAGGGYLGVSAKGGLYACHRFVDDDLGAMGNVTDGVDKTRQRQWLADRNVHAQEPCRTCWARYLCSGGCHYEVIRKGRPACDYIRGWLHYCLGVYGTLVQGDRALLDRVFCRGRRSGGRRNEVGREHCGRRLRHRRRAGGLHLAHRLASLGHDVHLSVSPFLVYHVRASLPAASAAAGVIGARDWWSVRVSAPRQIVV